MPVIQLEQGDIALHYAEAGDPSAPLVVLLHGFPFTSDMWQPQIDALSAIHRVIAPDLRGFGGSGMSADRYTMAGLADDVAQLIDVVTGESAVTIGGLSMGGYIAFEFYQRHRDRVQALILADTRPDPDSDDARANRRKMAQLALSQGSRAVADQLAPKLTSPDTRRDNPEAVRVLRMMMESVEPRTMEAALMAMASRSDSGPLLRDIDVPVLVISGADDVITPPAQTRGWASRIPKARFEIIEAAGHVSSLEQPQAFNELLLEFLAGAARA